MSFPRLSLLSATAWTVLLSLTSAVHAQSRLTLQQAMKDPSITHVPERLRHRPGEQAFDITDHWQDRQFILRMSHHAVLGVECHAPELIGPLVNHMDSYVATDGRSSDSARLRRAASIRLARS